MHCWCSDILLLSSTANMLFADWLADSIAMPLSLIFAEIVRSLYSLPTIRHTAIARPTPPCVA